MNEFQQKLNKMKNCQQYLSKDIASKEWKLKDCGDVRYEMS